VCAAFCGDRIKNEVTELSRERWSNSPEYFCRVLVMYSYDPKVHTRPERGREKKREGKKRGDDVWLPCRFTLLIFNERFSRFS
jgi:hypothetical protein